MVSVLRNWYLSELFSIIWDINYRQQQITDPKNNKEEIYKEFFVF